MQATDGPDGPIEGTDRPFGPKVFNGKLQFEMANGTKVICNCIRDPFATQIMKMLEDWKQNG